MGEAIFVCQQWKMKYKTTKIIAINICLAGLALYDLQVRVSAVIVTTWAE